jgi:hypothetical protein
VEYNHSTTPLLIDSRGAARDMYIYIVRME